MPYSTHPSYDIPARFSLRRGPLKRPGVPTPSIFTYSLNTRAHQFRFSTSDKKILLNPIHPDLTHQKRVSACCQSHFETCNYRTALAHTIHCPAHNSLTE